MSYNKIVIINYGLGNLGSVYNALKYLKIDAEITNEKKKIEESRGIILPGVGAFGDTMKNLQDLGLIDVLKKQIDNGKPYLGICLGYQILFEESEETENVKGLNLLKGKVIKFKTKKLKIPQIGWNQIKIVKESPFLKKVSDESYFYFVHSYYPVPDDQGIVATTTEYDDVFASSINSDNIFATQFHPEKSQDMGLQMLKNFTEYSAQRN